MASRTPHCFCNWKDCKDLQAAIQKHTFKALSSTDSLDRLDRISKRQKISLENSSKQRSHTPLPSSLSSSSQLQVLSTDAETTLDDNDDNGVAVAVAVAVPVAATVDVDNNNGRSSPGATPPLETFNKYFQRKYQDRGCDIEAFRSYPYVRRDLKVVQLAYGRDHVVELAPKVYLVHCRGAGSSEDDCGLFAIRSKKPGNERRPACDACAAVLRLQRQKPAWMHQAIETDPILAPGRVLLH
jgi:hypothetical protein